MPLWLQVTQAILLLILSLLGAWIAYKQSQIAAAKYNLDLFEKRFEIFEGARDFVATIFQHAEFDNSALATYNYRTANAVFLFEPEIKEYIDALRRKALSLRMKQRQLKGAEGDAERHDRLVDELADLETEFATEHERLMAVFQPYLKLRNISAVNDLARVRTWLGCSWQRTAAHVKKTWDSRFWPTAKG